MDRASPCGPAFAAGSPSSRRSGSFWGPRRPFLSAASGFSFAIIVTTRYATPYEPGDGPHRPAQALVSTAACVSSEIRRWRLQFLGSTFYRPSYYCVLVLGCDANGGLHGWAGPPAFRARDDLPTTFLVLPTTPAPAVLLPGTRLCVCRSRVHTLRCVRRGVCLRLSVRVRCSAACACASVCSIRVRMTPSVSSAYSSGLDRTCDPSLCLCCCKQVVFLPSHACRCLCRLDGPCCVRLRGRRVPTDPCGGHSQPVRPRISISPLLWCVTCHCAVGVVRVRA